MASLFGIEVSDKPSDVEDYTLSVSELCTTFAESMHPVICNPGPRYSPNTPISTGHNPSDAAFPFISMQLPLVSMATSRGIIALMEHDANIAKVVMYIATLYLASNFNADDDFRSINEQDAGNVYPRWAGLRPPRGRAVRQTP